MCGGSYVIDLSSLGTKRVPSSQVAPPSPPAFCHLNLSFRHKLILQPVQCQWLQAPRHREVATRCGTTYNTSVAGPSVVLDTNVLVAALRSRRGASFQVVSEIGRDRFEFVLSVPLLLEYEQALLSARPPGVNAQDVQVFLDYLCLEARLQEIFYLWRPHLRDPKYDLVLEAAVAGGCEAVVTHNRRHFEGAAKFGISVLSPAEFAGRLGVLA